MSPVPEPPDEKKDVIIRRGNSLWNVVIGSELLDAFEQKAAAVTEALKLAWANGCRVWLDDGAPPLKPVTNDDRAVIVSTTCPNGHEVSQAFVVGELRSALDTGAAKLRCPECQSSWTPDAAETASLRKLIAPFEPKSD